VTVRQTDRRNWLSIYRAQHSVARLLILLIKICCMVYANVQVIQVVCSFQMNWQLPLGNWNGSASSARCAQYAQKPVVRSADFFNGNCFALGVLTLLTWFCFFFCEFWRYENQMLVTYFVCFVAFVFCGFFMAEKHVVLWCLWPWISHGLLSASDSSSTKRFHLHTW